MGHVCVFELLLLLLLGYNVETGMSTVNNAHIPVNVVNRTHNPVMSDDTTHISVTSRAITHVPVTSLNDTHSLRTLENSVRNTVTSIHSIPTQIPVMSDDSTHISMTNNPMTAKHSTHTPKTSDTGVDNPGVMTNDTPYTVSVNVRGESTNSPLYAMTVESEESIFEDGTALSESDVSLHVSTVVPYDDGGPPLATCDTYNRVIYVFVTWLLGAVGVISNVLTMVVIWPDRAKSATMLLLLILAMADLSVIVSYTYMLVSPTLAAWLGDWDYLAYYTYLNTWMWAVTNIAQCAATWLVVLITIQRYVAVCHPHSAKRWNSIAMVRKASILIILAAIIFNIPRFLEYHIVAGPSGPQRTQTAMAHSNVYQLFYRAFLYYFCVWLLPLVVMIYATTRLIQALKVAYKKRAVLIQQNPQTTSSTQQNDITLSLVVVVILFMVCQLANPLRRILVAILPPEDLICGTFFFYFEPFSGLAILFNSSINFTVFCLCTRGFRREVIKKLRHMLRMNRVAPSGTSSSSFVMVSARTTDTVLDPRGPV